jgi:hypothetical protein
VPAADAGPPRAWLATNARLVFLETWRALRDRCGFIRPRLRMQQA